MATIDLGKLGFVNKGTYSSSTSYEKNDLVQYTDSGILSTYLYINAAAATGQTPSTSGTVNGTYWAYYAKGGAAGTDLTSTLTTQGDIVYRGGSGLARLGYGTAGQVLQTGGSGANPSWVTASSGKIKQVVYANSSNSSSTTSTSFQATGVTANITPNHANNLILIWATLGEPDQIDGRLACHVHKNGSALTYGRLVTEMGRGLSNTGAETHRGTIGFNVVNVAGGTSQITYDLKFKSGNGGTVRFGNGGSSNIILMEYEV
jgi:hypothetical protein